MRRVRGVARNIRRGDSKDGSSPLDEADAPSAADFAAAKFISYADFWPLDHPPFVSHVGWMPPRLPDDEAERSALGGVNRVAPVGPDVDDPGFAYMLNGAKEVYSRDDLSQLVQAASVSRGLVDTPSGSLRVMDADTGREAGRFTRDLSEWSTSVDAVNGRLLILYGTYAVAAVRRHLGEHAPSAELPHLEGEKAELRGLMHAFEIPKHRFKCAWRIRWNQPESYGEGYFTLEETAIPQMWWAVAQNVIVPLKVVEVRAAMASEERSPHAGAWRARARMLRAAQM